MTLRQRRIAVLGAGIMGCSLALMLARRGARVDLIDQSAAPMTGASRWNEGKIHLGYIYGADASLRTARHVIPGGLRFGPLLAELIGRDCTPQISQSDDTFLVHRDSIADPQALTAIYERISALLSGHPDAAHYLTDVSAARAVAMTQAQIDEVASPQHVVAGFRVPERSINTQWVADRMVDAVAAEPGITLRGGVTVTAAQPRDGSSGAWFVTGTPDFRQSYDLVINALWNGRLGIDRTAGLPYGKIWSNRYRLSVFARTLRPVAASSAIIAVGPFGDVKNYNGRDFYLSWYPSGLICDLPDLVPAVPQLSDGSRAAVVGGIRKHLVPVLPPVAEILDQAETLRVEGGFVFAHGQGPLSDPASSLHRRDRFGIHRRGNYFSVDTGKYSTAPWLAAKLVATIADDS